MHDCVPQYMGDGEDTARENSTSYYIIVCAISWMEWAVWIWQYFPKTVPTLSPASKKQTYIVLLSF